jgi:FlaG/FlaF family flagellin (archaellin)
VSDGFWIAITVAAAAMFASLVNGVVGVMTLKQGAATHKIVNSGWSEFKDELLKATRLEVQAAFADGMKQGLLAGRTAADKRTDQLSEGTPHS